MTAGYTFANVPWSPNVTLGYQTFSGDDPNTPRLERFDPLYYQGSPSAWATGSKSASTFINSNVNALTLALRVQPTQADSWTFRYAHIRANELNSPVQFGQLMLNGGELNGQRLFPSEVVAKIRAGGDRSKFGSGFPTVGAGSYTSQWWVFHNDHGAYAARGVHGQTIYIDPTAEMVLVRLASYPRAQNGFIDPTSLPAYQAVAEFLMSRD